MQILLPNLNPLVNILLTRENSMIDIRKYSKLRVSVETHDAGKAKDEEIIEPSINESIFLKTPARFYVYI